MNFKPTKTKSLASLIVAIIVGIIAYTSAGCFDCTVAMIQTAKMQATIYGFVASLLVVYVVWSLFDKKK